jgi:hypothetical protein
MQKPIVMVCLTTFLITQVLRAQTESSKLPQAPAILDRYVEVTGGAGAYSKASVEIIDSIVTSDPPTGQSLDITNFRSRDGQRRTEVEVGPDFKQSGVWKGTVWEYSRKTSAQIITGKRAERELAKKEFTPETWRQEFPQATTIGEATVNGQACSKFV